MSTVVTVKLTVDQLDKIRRLLRDYERKLLLERDEVLGILAKRENGEPFLEERIKSIDRDLFAISKLTETFS